MGEPVAQRMYQMAQGEFARGMHEEALRLCDRSLHMHKLDGVQEFRDKVQQAMEGELVLSCVHPGRNAR